MWRATRLWRYPRRVEIYRDAINRPEHYWKIIPPRIMRCLCINAMLIIFYTRGIRSDMGELPTSRVSTDLLKLQINRYRIINRHISERVKRYVINFPPIFESGPRSLKRFHFTPKDANFLGSSSPGRRLPRVPPASLSSKHNDREQKIRLQRVDGGQSGVTEEKRIRFATARWRETALIAPFVRRDLMLRHL